MKSAHRPTAEPTSRGPYIRSARGGHTRAAVAVLAGLSVATLAGCQTSGTERPQSQQSPVAQQEQATTGEAVPAPADPSPGAVESAAGAEPTSGAGDTVTVVDSSPGGPQSHDPLWAGLDTAADDHADVYLRTLVHVGVPPGQSGTVTLTPDSPNSVSVTVNAKAVHKQTADAFYMLQGTFSVNKTADSAYSLTLKSTAEKKDLNPRGAGTKERCTAPDAVDVTQRAADELADGKKSREQLRKQWGAAPEVWWGIQLTAASLKQSDGDSAGDYLTQACRDFLPGDAG